HTFVLLHLPLPPSSPLFPYTTLFRSVAARLCYAHGVAVNAKGIEALIAQQFHKATQPATKIDDPLAPSQHRHIDAVQRGLAVDRDRKSTRLNSSHVKISYAVFCLKKK